MACSILPLCSDFSYNKYLIEVKKKPLLAYIRMLHPDAGERPLFIPGFYPENVILHQKMWFHCNKYDTLLFLGGQRSTLLPKGSKILKYPRFLTILIILGHIRPFWTVLHHNHENRRKYWFWQLLSNNLIILGHIRNLRRPFLDRFASYGM